MILDKTYHGFEDIYDLPRDIDEMWCNDIEEKIPNEYQGAVQVLVIYRGESNE